MTVQGIVRGISGLTDCCGIKLTPLCGHG